MEKRAIKALEALNVSNADLSLLITDDQEIRDLNRIYRDKDKPTDVLSFPMGDRVGDRIILGDVVISLDTAQRQAEEEEGISLEEVVERLLVHGIVHLLGYDHERGGEEELEFKRLEALALDHLRGR